MENMKEKVKEFILSELRVRSAAVDESNIKESLIESGIIDSFGFLELLMSIEQKFQVQMNFLELDPSVYTRLEGLIDLCVQAHARKEGKS